MAKKKKREAKQRHHKKVARFSLSFLSLAESANAAKEERGKCFCSLLVVCLWRDFLSLEESVFSLKCASE